MLSLRCPRHGTVLLGLDRLVRLHNLGDGLILVEARCDDGELLLAVRGHGSVLPPDAVAHRPATD